jgi:hypothetical protein
MIINQRLDYRCEIFMEMDHKFSYGILLCVQNSSHGECADW